MAPGGSESDSESGSMQKGKKLANPWNLANLKQNSFKNIFSFAIREIDKSGLKKIISINFIAKNNLKNSEWHFFTMSQNQAPTEKDTAYK